jgi:hypothetical protein
VVAVSPARLVAVAFGVVASLVVPAPASLASGLPPRTQPDAVTVRIDGREAHLDLGANDVDPEGDPLSFAGVDTADAHIPGVGIVDNTRTGGPQDVVVFASTIPRPGDTSAVVAGTYTVRTYMYDGSNLAASTLTIVVLPPLQDHVSVERKRPGRAVVHNDLDTPIRFMWGAQDHKRADGRVDIPAHSSRSIDVERRSLLTLVLADGDYGLGSARHLRPPRDGSALDPGLPDGFDLLHASLTHWVRKAIS